MSARLKLADVLGNSRVAAALTLGFASGLPFNLSQGTLQAWLASLDVSLKTIGWLTWVGMPYLFKFLWAPLLDRYVPPFLGRRRGWIVLFQVGIAATTALRSGNVSRPRCSGWAGIRTLRPRQRSTASRMRRSMPSSRTDRSRNSAGERLS